MGLLSFFPRTIDLIRTLLRTTNAHNAGTRSALSTTTPHTAHPCVLAEMPISIAQLPVQNRRVKTHIPPDGKTPRVRLVISGRMADVCAELDRLAAAEGSLTRCH